MLGTAVGTVLGKCGEKFGLRWKCVGLSGWIGLEICGVKLLGLVWRRVGGQQV